MRKIAARVLPVPTSIVSILSFITDSGDVLRRAIRPAVSQFNRVQLGKTFRVLLQFSQHLGYRAMTHAKAAYAKLVERAHRGQIANASGAFNIDSAFKLVGDDADFFYRGAGGAQPVEV